MNSIVLSRQINLYKSLHRASVRTSATSSQSQPKPSGNTTIAKAAVTSALMSGAGDLLAQTLQWKYSKEGHEYSPVRTARMFSFGLLLYGPAQFWWYGMLDKSFGAKTLYNFIMKVTLNQIALGPAVLSSAFAWNYCLTGRQAELKDKIKNDLLPSLVTGWKFWVPAAIINFKYIPLRYQVAYMSACGVIWTAFVSYTSAVDYTF